MAAATNDLWADVRAKLIFIFDDNEVDLARLLCFLIEEETKFGNDAPTLKTLKSAINQDSSFRTLAQRLADKIRTTENNSNLDPNPNSSNLLYEKLIAFFANNREDLLRVLFVLNEEETTSGTRNTRTWTMLKSVMHNGDWFEVVAQRIADKTKTTENDRRFRAAMPTLYENLQHVATGRIEFETANESTGGFDRALAFVPASTKAGILDKLANISLIVNPLEVSAFMFAFGIEPIPLVAIVLTWEVMRSIYQWRAGKISGNRCLKIVTDSAASIGGVIGGAAIGCLLGPAGALGVILGGAIGGYASNSVSSYLTQYLFGIPQDEALENAYKFLNVHMRSSNSDIDSTYRRLCLKYHPDKGGSIDEFIKLQMCMQKIRVARGDVFAPSPLP